MNQSDEHLNEENPQGRDDTRESLTFMQTLLSVIQASFGVQNSKNRKRDFEKGSITGFIAAALIFTVLFVLTLVVVVKLVLP